MTILALELSSPQRSAAIARGGTILAEVTQAGQRHTAVFAMIEELLTRAKIAREEIEALAVGLGPGSYTGVRAALAAAQGWQVVRGTKITGVSSMAAMAAQAQAGKIFGRVNIVVDAQREEFYLAVYELEESASREAEPLKILPRAHIQTLAGEGRILAGPEAAEYFPNYPNVRTIFPRASAVGALAAAQKSFPPAGSLAPIYLRETNFTKWPETRPGRNESGHFWRGFP